jgi:hypothetical protein
MEESANGFIKDFIIATLIFVLIFIRSSYLILPMVKTKFENIVDYFFPIRGTLVIVGSKGSGKSKTGNNLIGKKVFTVSDVLAADGTFEINQASKKSAFWNNWEYLTVVDCPGFGYDPIPNNNAADNAPINGTIRLYESLIAKQNIFVNKNMRFVMCVKFESRMTALFHEAATDFIKAFGNKGIKSLFIIVIQVKVIQPIEDVRGLLENEEGYKLLKNENNNKDIPFCLWENETNESNDFQNSEFGKCLKSVELFNFTTERIEVIQKAKTIREHEITIQSHEATIQRHEATIQRHEATIQSHAATIQRHEATIQRHDNKNKNKN